MSEGIEVVVACWQCDGIGTWETGGQCGRCPDCNGTGRVRTTTLEVPAEVERLRAEAELYHRGYAAMGAADISEYLALCQVARSTESDALARLEAWRAEDETGWKRTAFVKFVGNWMVRLADVTTGCRDVVVFSCPIGRPAQSNERYHEVVIGTLDQPASLADCILAALDRWAELNGKDGAA